MWNKFLPYFTAKIDEGSGKRKKKFQVVDIKYKNNYYRNNNVLQLVLTTYQLLLNNMSKYELSSAAAS